jgi:hypothetical protein
MFSIEQMITTLSCGVAHHLELVLLPPESDRSISTASTGDSARPALDDRLVLLAVVGDAAARPPSVNDGRMIAGKPVHSATASSASSTSSRSSPAALEADALHRLAEQLAVLRHLDRPRVGADQLHPVLREHAALVQRHRHVERGLAAHRGQQRVRRSRSMTSSTNSGVTGSM